MPYEIRNRPVYDVPTAVTFLAIGLAVGSLVAAIFSAIQDARKPRNRELN